MLNMQACENLVSKEYPAFKVAVGFEYENLFFFLLMPKGVAADETPIIDIHAVDPKTGKVTGYLPTMRLMADEKFVAAFEKAIDQTGDVIEHHGIDGQKWGVRNGPPYPLSEEKHDKVVKAKNGYSKLSSSKKNEGSAVLAAVGVEVAATAAIVATMALASNLSDRHQHKKKIDAIQNESKLLDEKGIADTNKRFDDEHPPKTIEGAHSPESDMAKVNPLFDKAIPGTTQNCVLCSLTYDLRRRGYDVTAKLSNEPMNTERVLKSVYKSKHETEYYTDCHSFEKVESNMLKKYPDNSRGIFLARHYSSLGYMGHAMAWEIKGGKVYVYDTQSNKKVKLTKADMGLLMPTMSGTVRTDNLEINWKKMSDICAERLGKEVKHSMLFDEFLEHSGIKGMKWGVRRYQNKDGTLTPEGKIRYGKGDGESNDSKKESDDSKPRYDSGTKSYKKSDTRHLTDEELTRRVKRLTQENNYRDQLKKAKEADMSKRQKLVQKIFVDSASNAAAQVMQNIYTKATMAFITDKFPSLVGEKKKK